MPIVAPMYLPRNLYYAVVAQHEYGRFRLGRADVYAD